MDNVTHSLVGLGIAKIAVAIKNRPGAAAIPVQGRKDAFLCGLVGIVASNLPDLDLAFSGLTDGKLGYLLHHRGHTHTLLGLLPLVALCVGGVMLANRLSRKDYLTTSSDLFAVIGVTIASLAMHIVMDYGNSYGVHPFWPFSYRWFYGDSLFIVEPWLWTSMAASLFWGGARIWSRTFYALIIVTGIGLAFFSGLVPIVMAVIVMAWCVTLLLVLRQRETLTLGLSTLVSAGAICMIFGTSHTFGSRLARQDLILHQPGLKLTDLIMSPLPANPICWKLIAVGQEKNDFVLQRGTLSLLPGLIKNGDCPGRDGEPTAPMKPLRAREVRGGDEPNDLEHVKWNDEFRAPTAKLIDSAKDCRVRALLRFVRAPFWKTNQKGATIIGDLRFDRDPGLGFTEISFEKLGSSDIVCPKLVPPWQPPVPLVEEK